MNPEHKRIVELANGWEDSEADISVSPSDALLLESVGCPIKRGKRDNDPATVKGTDLFAAAQTLQQSFHETPEGAEPTPNQQSVTGPGTDPKTPGTAPTTAPTTADEGDGLDEMTVAELKDAADAEDVDVPSNARKDEIVKAIRKSRTTKK